jgi:hypothetical protein
MGRPRIRIHRDVNQVARKALQIIVGADEIAFLNPRFLPF